MIYINEKLKSQKKMTNMEKLKAFLFLGALLISVAMLIVVCLKQSTKQFSTGSQTSQETVPCLQDFEKQLIRDGILVETSERFYDSNDDSISPNADDFSSSRDKSTTSSSTSTLSTTPNSSSSSSSMSTHAQAHSDNESPKSKRSSRSSDKSNESETSNSTRNNNSNSMKKNASIQQNTEEQRKSENNETKHESNDNPMSSREFDNFIYSNGTKSKRNNESTNSLSKHSLDVQTINPPVSPKKTGKKRARQNAVWSNYNTKKLTKLHGGRRQEKINSANIVLWVNNLILRLLGIQKTLNPQTQLERAYGFKLPQEFKDFMNNESKIRTVRYTLERKFDENLEIPVLETLLNTFKNLYLQYNPVTKHLILEQQSEENFLQDIERRKESLKKIVQNGKTIFYIPLSYFETNSTNGHRIGLILNINDKTVGLLDSLKQNQKKLLQTMKEKFEPFFQKAFKDMPAFKGNYKWFVSGEDCNTVCQKNDQFCVVWSYLIYFLYTVVANFDNFCSEFSKIDEQLAIRVMYAFLFHIEKPLSTNNLLLPAPNDDNQIKIKLPRILPPDAIMA